MENFMPDIFRFVIVGSGNIARTYIQAAGNLDRVQIAGIVSRTGLRPDDSPPDLEVAVSLDQIQQNFDAVILATPNGLHHAGAVEAAAMGKHVLTEKPLDVSVAHMDQMIQSCRDAGVRLGVTYQQRMSPDNQSMKSLLDSGQFGRLYAADFVVRCFRDQGYYNSGAWRGGWDIDGGGPFIQQACHQVDLYVWFFGMPDQVQAFTGTFAHDIDVEDHGVAIFRYPNGMIGSFLASTIAKPGFDPVLTLHTEYGTVIMENGKITGWFVPGIDNPSQKPDGIIHSGATSAAVTDTSGHEAILLDFVEAVREKRDPAVSGESARLATELILKIYGKL